MKRCSIYGKDDVLYITLQRETNCGFIAQPPFIKVQTSVDPGLLGEIILSVFATQDFMPEAIAPQDASARLKQCHMDLLAFAEVRSWRPFSQAPQHGAVTVMKTGAEIVVEAQGLSPKGEFNGQQRRWTCVSSAELGQAVQATQDWLRRVNSAPLDSGASLL